MRPTTSTNNSKTSGKPFEKTPFVSTPFRDQNSIQQFDEIFEARRFVFLPTQDIILNEIAARRVKFGFEILVLERKIC